MTNRACRLAGRPLTFAMIGLAAALAACSADHPTAPALSDAVQANQGRGRDGGDVPSVVSVRVARMLPNDVLATVAGVPVFNGGFGSALDRSPFRPDELYSLTDRGPNISGSGDDKLFPVPDFHPQVGVFERRGDRLVRSRVIVLRDAAGKALTGLPPAGTGNTGEIPRTLTGALLPNDPNGIDSEGLRVMRDGSFWVSDEYGPFLVHFDRSGRTIERDSPTGGPHPLPAVLLRRQANKGMEGLASIRDGRELVGMMQNPLVNPDKAAAKASRLLRIVFVDAMTGKTRQYAYLMDDASYGVSDIESVSPTEFLVDERDGKFFGDPSGPAAQKKIYLIDVSKATDISDPANSAAGLTIGGKTLEQMSDADLSANRIVPVTKTLVVDLLAHGYTHDKAEGVALIDGGRTIAVSNDDDFGVTDDGDQHLLQKLLPSGLVDHNEVWFFTLARSLTSRGK